MVLKKEYRNTNAIEIKKNGRDYRNGNWKGGEMEIDLEMKVETEMKAEMQAICN